MSNPESFLPTRVAFERRQISLWIATEGKMISLERPAAMQRTGAGGYAPSGNSQVLPPKLRIMSTQARSTFLQNTDVGVGIDIKQYLLGTYDDDIRQGDSFTDPDTNVRFVVEKVVPDRTVETRAELTEIE